MAFRVVLEISCLLMLMLVCITDAKGGEPPKVFHVLTYGAVADGKTDNAPAFLKAWRVACEWRGRSRVLIPEGTYLLGSVVFQGPCKGPISFLIKGVLKAPTDPALFFTDHWISFQFIDQLVVKGGGSLDGQGSSAWPYNDCFKNPHCKPLPVTMRFDFITNSRVHHLKSFNSKNSHFNLFACNNMNISNIRITAPAQSPNTDGIHIGTSANIKISRSLIGTGDDCISMVAGSQNIDITDVSCGPGHGFSVGSLGKSHNEEYVTGITIRNCTLSNTDNGLRIKTWAPSLPTVASGFTFEDIMMNNVFNPIIIDQQYCPSPNCDNNAYSEVQIRNVTFKNIWGVSSSKVAVNLKCSGSVPCENIKLVDINLAYKRGGGPATSLCSNVKGQSSGRENPPGCI